jgi:hypothetical protein
MKYSTTATSISSLKVVGGKELALKPPEDKRRVMRSRN